MIQSTSAPTEKGKINMTFTYRVFYEDDCRWNYGKLLSKRVRAKSPEKAMEKFQKKYGIKPLRAE